MISGEKKQDLGKMHGELQLCLRYFFFFLILSKYDIIFVSEKDLVIFVLFSCILNYFKIRKRKQLMV